MNKTVLLYCGLIFVGGLGGGAITGALCRSHPVAAAPQNANDTNETNAPTGRVVIASEFVLTDAAGKPRARIEVSRDGKAQFAMYDQQSHPRAQIAVDDLGAPSVQLYDTSNRLRLSLEVSTDGIPTVRLMDSSARARELLGVDAEGEAGLNFYAQDGRVLRELP